MIKPIFHFESEHTGKHVVIVPACHDYKHYNAEWMDRPDGETDWLQPDVDLRETEYWFDTEQEALQKVAELYAAQLNDR